VGTTDQGVESRRLRRLCLFRQRSEKCGAPVDALQLKALLGQLPKAMTRTHRKKKAA
jgi:hypothetical protein